MTQARPWWERACERTRRGGLLLHFVLLHAVLLHHAVVFLHAVLGHRVLLHAVILGHRVFLHAVVLLHRILGEGGGGERQAERKRGSRNSKRNTGGNGHG